MKMTNTKKFSIAAVVLGLGVLGYGYFTKYTVTFTHNPTPGADKAISSMTPEKSTLKKIKAENILETGKITSATPEKGRASDWSLSIVTGKAVDVVRAELYLNEDGSSIYRDLSKAERGSEFYALTKEKTDELIKIAPEQ